MSQYNISHAEDQAASPMEDSEQFAKVHPSFMAECQNEMSRGLAKMEVEDLPRITLLIASCTPVLKKILLRVMIERYEAEIKLLKSQEQTRDLNNEQDTYDVLKPTEDKEESDQELPDCLPTSCIMLIREYHDLIVMENRERCLKETRDHIEEEESDVEEEAQENIPPPSQLMQEKENRCASVNDDKETPLLTKEEIDQISNQYSTSEIFYKTHTLAQSSYEFDDTDPEDPSVDRDEEVPAENPTGLIGDIAYVYDFPSYDLFDDDCFQREAKPAEPSSVDPWEESQGQQLQRSSEPSQPIYDTDGESYESINDECHVIGDQQSFLS